MDAKNPNNTYTKEQLWNRDAAISRLAGNEGLLNRIVDMFLSQIEQKQLSLKDAADRQDAEAVRFNSHAMKGVSGDVGADAIRERACAIEAQAKQGDLSQINGDIRALDDIINQTISVMRY
ncbi:Hpt domain-containing protein [Alteromonas gracilis]|uniref:Hpt domain-containing protein n=1 Tax=Alteromonas gracilis TaxID=1479524 RepID=UPI0037361C3A